MSAKIRKGPASASLQKREPGSGGYVSILALGGCARGRISWDLSKSLPLPDRLALHRKRWGICGILQRCFGFLPPQAASRAAANYTIIEADAVGMTGPWAPLGERNRKLRAISAQHNPPAIGAAKRARQHR